MPTIRSRLRSATSRHSRASSRRTSLHSPTMTRLREGEDPGERDVEVGQDADRGALDDVRAEAVEVAGPGAAGIDQRGGARALRDRHRLHAEAGAAPVDVGVEVDQPRHHELAGRGQRLARLAGSIALSTAATLPSWNATSRGASMPCAGSITRPPLITRSYIAFDHCPAELRFWFNSRDQQAHKLIDPSAHNSDRGAARQGLAIFN